MPTLHDEILGDVIIRRSRRASSIRIKYTANGKYTASIPMLTPLFYIKRIIRDSRIDLLKLADEIRTESYLDQQKIGQSHTLAVVMSGLVSNPKIQTIRDRIVLTLPHTTMITDKDVQEMIRVEVVKILRKEAKEYLPNKLSELAERGHFKFQKIRFSHSTGRWGSCSSNGTISLNIALMKLQPQLIEYVLIHELAHTVEMNHSARFWNVVGQYDPLYKLHRQQMKKYTPHL